MNPFIADIFIEFVKIIFCKVKAWSSDKRKVSPQNDVFRNTRVESGNEALRSSFGIVIWHLHSYYHKTYFFYIIRHSFIEEKPLPLTKKFHNPFSHIRLTNEEKITIIFLPLTFKFPNCRLPIGPIVKSPSILGILYYHLWLSHLHTHSTTHARAPA